jgi:hypothetical protein
MNTLNGFEYFGDSTLENIGCYFLYTTKYSVNINIYKGSSSLFCRITGRIILSCRAGVWVGNMSKQHILIDATNSINMFLDN